MKSEVRVTVDSIKFINLPTLKSSASMVKFFLIELRKNTSSWNLWKRLAINTVIEILDILDGEL